MSNRSLQTDFNQTLETPSLQMSVPLSDKNWFKTGGSARLFAEPTTVQEFQHLLSYAQSVETPFSLIGEGANLLISDEGFNGLVIRPNLTKIKRLPYDETHDLVQADAGVKFSDLITWCLDSNLIGLEEFSGIPGTVGGSVFINIHYFEHLLSTYLVGAQVITQEDNLIRAVDNAWFNFGYNYSTLHEQTAYLVNATFKLKKVDTPTAYHAQGRSEEMIRHRLKRYPHAFTCGSFFRNFHPHEVAHLDKKLIYVAYYLDKIGIKGELSVGGAHVSYQHANMIVNDGTATTSDIIALVRIMQSMVQEKFGILPHPECRLLGFADYPLLS
ncbi:UDP-N-acetylmuramate dehydrogenase [Candidatus Dependentiae bacterium]|nr:UDP-N-acetylmuramate dehydrogenase [Candidatus Dependentiae bacterium]